MNSTALVQASRSKRDYRKTQARQFIVGPPVPAALAADSRSPRLVSPPTGAMVNKILLVGTPTTGERSLMKFYHRIERITRIFDFSQSKKLSFYKPFPCPVERRSDGNPDEHDGL